MKPVVGLRTKQSSLERRSNLNEQSDLDINISKVKVPKTKREYMEEYK